MTQELESFLDVRINQALIFLTNKITYLHITLIHGGGQLGKREYNAFVLQRGNIISIIIITM